jgi:hypothetical protein
MRRAVEGGRTPTSSAPSEAFENREPSPSLQQPWRRCSSVASENRSLRGAQLSDFDDAHTLTLSPEDGGERTGKGPRIQDCFLPDGVRFLGVHFFLPLGLQSHACRLGSAVRSPRETVP